MRLSILAALLFVPIPLAADVKPGTILPADANYDPAVPTPRQFFGFPVGEKHLQHHQLVGYMRRLAKESPRVELRQYARSHGGRPLMVLTITTPENHARLDDIRKRHVELTKPHRSKDIDTAAMPAVIYMGYGVHGDEPSASNVAPLVAYHLAAGTGPDHEKLLSEVVVLLDPCLNPDGFERFANWSNDHRGAVPNPDPQDREHRQPWPGGRTNYYWFDLNRDWLPARHPESKGRLRVFHQWKPNVVLDYHEMGTDSTYFFQPGEPKRFNPLTPKKNVELTRRFADYHAAALDKAGSLYFTEERFDDFYPGKGSTYPDLHGSVGILFEQASARGRVQDSPHGLVSLPFAIRNHFLTSMSSLKATHELRGELLEYQRDAYLDAAEMAKNDGPHGYVVSCPGDPVRLHDFLSLLHLHDIKSYRLNGDLAAGDQTFSKGDAYVIPSNQPEYRFLRSLFDRRSEFEEDIFYDVSAWTLPLAFHIQTGELDQPPAGVTGEPFDPKASPGNELTVREDDLGYLIRWPGSHAPAALHRLQKAGVKVKVATEPFRPGVDGNVEDFGYGTLMVPLGIQPNKREAAVRILKTAAKAGVEVVPLRGGLSQTGIDLGSAGFPVLPEAKVVLVTGPGVSGYQAGEVWHLFDRTVRMPLTRIDADDLGSADLSDYTAVVLASGSYGSVSPGGVAELREFVTGGGTLIAIGSAAEWVNANKIAAVPFREEKPKEGEPRDERRPYAEAQTDSALKLIGGAIFKTELDHTHPIGYGFRAGDSPAVIRGGATVLDPTESPYSTPLIYAEEPLLSGYASEENRKKLAKSASIVVLPSGRGRVVVMMDDPNFRAFWPATSRLFLNAVFFGPIIR